jgi:geranylgeranyl pyrophosphate synthase
MSTSGTPSDFSEHAEAGLASALVRHAPADWGMETRLRAAIDQIVGRPGKLLRARLVYAGARRHGLRPADAERLACAVEYFHAASLVLDDLPCMDDAAVRRGVPCVHRQHGEATAILASLALINRAYRLIHESLAARPRAVREAANRCVERCLGVAGIVGGQAWDLAFAETDQSARRVSRIAAAKTGALFELAVLLPAELARPAAGERRALRALCVYWGQLFQIADDVRDIVSSTYAAGKTTGRDRRLVRPNLAVALGAPAACVRMARLVRLADRALARLAARDVDRWSYLLGAGQALSRSVAVPEEAASAA